MIRRRVRRVRRVRGNPYRLRNRLKKIKPNTERTVENYSHMLRLGTIMPQRLMVKVPYQERVLMVSAGGVIAVQNWRLNSLGDPNETSTGHQPLGSDQWAAFYSNYRVLACKYTVQVSSYQSSDVTPNLTTWNINVVATDDLTTVNSLSMDNVSELKGCTNRVFNTSASTPLRIKKFIKLKNIFGVNRRQIMDEQLYSSTFGSNPGNQAYITMMVQPVDQAASSRLGTYTKMVFYAVLSNPKDLSLS